jgi:DNA topoisomerase-6 subunit B
MEVLAQDGGIATQNERFMEISPADFFYRNRELAGFNNPTRAIYAAVRELIENSLDACELYKIPPRIFIRLSDDDGAEDSTYRLRVADNGSGIPPEYIPSSFGQILFGSKYRLRQVRGTFGLGGKMAVLYGQITTHGSAVIRSSTARVSIGDLCVSSELRQGSKTLLLRLDAAMMKRRGIDRKRLLAATKIARCTVQVQELTPRRLKTLFKTNDGHRKAVKFLRLIRDDGAAYAPEEFIRELGVERKTFAQMTRTLRRHGFIVKQRDTWRITTPLRVKTRSQARLRQLPPHVKALLLPVAINEVELTIDIQRNRPNILREEVLANPNAWRGTTVEFSLEGDFTRAMPKILEYFKQTAMVNPYAEITFIDPRGRLYLFESGTTKMPAPPVETLPHPHGCDVETVQRIITATTSTNMLSFMMTHFHRVGKVKAKAFLREANIDPEKDPRDLSANEIVVMVRAMKTFKGFLPPDPYCLSPLGEELLLKGIEKELQPEFVYVEQRKPSAYSGYPFIIEMGIAYGGEVPSSSGITLYRFANKIPLLYDEASDVSRKVINEKKDWRRYKVSPDMPLAVVSHICSTKIPYKTVGKEFIADLPEVEKEIRNGLNGIARRLSKFLSRKISVEYERKRQSVFAAYLPKIAKFSTDLSGKRRVPDIEPLLRSLRR